MNTTTTQSLRERAAEALREHREKEAERERKREADAAHTAQFTWWSTLKQRLGIEREMSDLPLTLDSFWVEDGITFGFDPYHNDFCIFTSCRQCGEPAAQRVVEQGLVSVAEFLEGSLPQNKCSACYKKDAEARRCPAPSVDPVPEPSLAEQLETLLRRIVRDEIRRGAMNRNLPTEEQVRGAWERVTCAGTPLADYDDLAPMVASRGCVPCLHADRPEPGQRWAAWCVFSFCALVAVAFAWQAFTQPPH